MATILITGGTGMIGKAIAKALLEKNYKVIILTRKLRDKRYGIKDAQNESLIANPVSHIAFAQWNIHEQTINEKAIQQADHIIHLAGANIAEKRWTQKRKKEIVDSRVKSSELLVKALKEIPNKVQSVISASAIGWYGKDPAKGNRGFTETDPPANNFLGETCRQWEESLQPVTGLGKRLVLLRTGIVLSKDEGALKVFEKPMQFGIAAILGNGKQVISWIHIDDLVRMYISAVENENMNGVYNAVAPNPVTNKELVIQLARSGKRFYIPVYVPSFILKLILGELSIEVLKSTTVSAEKIQQSGFVFRYPGIKSFL